MTHLTDEDLERALRALGDAAPPDGVRQRLTTALATAAAAEGRRRPGGATRWWPGVAVAAAVVVLAAVIAGWAIDSAGHRPAAHASTGFTLVDLRWQAGPALPAPRRSPAAVSVAGRVYVLGGRSLDGRGSVATSVYALNPPARRWQLVAELPQPRANAAAVEASGKIYVVGGDIYPSSGGRLAGQPMLVFNPATRSWSSVRVPGPPRVSPAVAEEMLHGDPTIFIFGGLGPSGGPAGNLAYDTVTGRFAKLPQAPAVFTDTAAVAVDGGIYLFGSANAEGLELPTVYRYLPTTGTFTSRAPIPHAITGVTWTSRSGAAIAGRVVLVADDYRGRRVDVYDPATNTWGSLPSLGLAQPGASVAAADQTLYVVGGSRLIDNGNAVAGMRAVETLTVQGRPS